MTSSTCHTNLEDRNDSQIHKTPRSSNNMRMLDSWYGGRRERGHHVAHVRHRGDHGFGVHALLVFIRRIAQMIPPKVCQRPNPRKKHYELNQALAYYGLLFGTAP